VRATGARTVAGMELGAGLMASELGNDPGAIRDFAQTIEGLGFDNMFTNDHVVGGHPDRLRPGEKVNTFEMPCHEPFVLLSFVAGATTRLGLVTSIVILPQRQTVLVAQQAADVDLLSHGRLRLGVGTGWNWVEYHALGQDFASRGRRITEQAQLLRRLWSEPLVSFEGEFDHIERGCINPRPRRMIPMWFGGFGDAAFRRASRLGDGFSFAGDVDSALNGVHRVNELLAAEGRDAGEFGRELILTRARTAADVVDTASKWADVGGSQVSIVTMKVGLDGHQAHVDHLAELKAAIDARFGS